ncbi:SET domain-containing protein [Trametes cingulata]|nr:SET domain-containing protein [Trametes cingulata]
MMNADAFAVKAIPGKGKGLVAARAIAYGELLLEEAPLFTQHHHIAENSLAAALSRLPRDDQLRYLSLANSWRGSHRPLSGIWLTNAIPCGTPEDPNGDETEVEGVFPTASLFNASCRPNVHHWWDPVKQRMVLRAERDIAQGEELCTAYTDILESRDERRAQLEEYYNFICCCVACSLTGGELRRSDRRREIVARVRGEMHEYADAALGLGRVKVAIQLLEEEGLLGSYGNQFYKAAFDLWALAGDAENARMWAIKAWELDCATKGPDSAPARHWKRLAERPDGSVESECEKDAYTLEGGEA